MEIAGKKLLYPEFRLDNNDDQLNGNLVLSFETLELVALSKFGGLIQVEETLSLSLSLTYT